MKTIIASALALGCLCASGAGAEDLRAAPAAAKPAVRFGTQPQELYMAKVTVSDLVKSYDFYTRILGLKLVTSAEMEMAGAPTAADDAKPFVEVALNYTGTLRDPMFILIRKQGVLPAREQAAQTWIAFKVPSTAAVMAAAERAGFKPSRPYQPGSPMGFLQDPDGYTIEVLQLPSY